MILVHRSNFICGEGAQNPTQCRTSTKEINQPMLLSTFSLSPISQSLKRNWSVLAAMTFPRQPSLAPFPSFKPAPPRRRPPPNNRGEKPKSGSKMTPLGLLHVSSITPSRAASRRPVSTTTLARLPKSGSETPIHPIRGLWSRIEPPQPHT